MREFPFELALCAHLEATTGNVIARQVGAGVHAPSNRIIDVLCVEPGPDFDARTKLTAERIPDAAIESDVGVGEARYWRDAFDTSPEYAREVVDRAVDIGFFERERRGGREYVRQVARYPVWFGRLVGIENKPDLSDPGDLETQLRKDVSLGLVDEVILATESYVTGAHLNRIPEEVGVWRFHVEEAGRGAVGNGGEIEVVREPTPLDTDGAGTELIEERSAERTFAWRARSKKPDGGGGWRNEHTGRAGGRTIFPPAAKSKPVPARSRTVAGRGGSSTPHGVETTVRDTTPPTRLRSIPIRSGTPGRRGLASRQDGRADRSDSADSAETCKIQSVSVEA